MPDASPESQPDFYPAQICFPTMPLAVYRELAAHLRQVPGAEAELLPQSSTVFDYQQSQVGGLMLRCSSAAQLRVQQILAYYSQRYGDWHANSDN